MDTLYKTLHYYLVDHHFISQYEWKPYQTPGASPLFISTTVVAYLTLTFLLHRYPILPTLSAAAIRRIAAVHNIILCLLSLLMAVGCTLSAIHQTPPENPTWWLCFPRSTTARGGIFFWAHVFYFSKILEFVDTLLILLSGSRAQRRLSFLHVYHHAAVVVLCYMTLVEAQSLLVVGLVTNSTVHVLMYAYYLLAALGYRPPWKRAVTNCQITQFLLGYLFSGFMLYLHFTGSGCRGIWLWGFSLAFTTSLLGLFVNFHLNNYPKKKKLDDQTVHDKDKRS